MRSLTAFRMVVHDRSSTAGALLGVVAIVFLVGQQLSILFGLLNYMSVLVDHSGADAWIMSANLRNVDAGNLVSTRYLDRVIGLGEVEVRPEIRRLSFRDRAEHIDRLAVPVLRYP